MWKSSNYEVIGRYHLKHGLPCQDKTLRLDHDGVSIIALADGAGSAKDSEAGAKAAVESAAHFVGRNFDALVNTADGSDVKLQIYETVISKLQEVSQFMECQITDLASTLLLAAVKDDAFLIVHIGDGVIGYLENSELKVASSPQNGEFANETVFMTSVGAQQMINITKGKIGQIEGFVLMSDGTASSFYNHKRGQLAAPLKSIFKKNSLLSNVDATHWLKGIFDEFIVTRTTDDCSIAVMSR